MAEPLTWLRSRQIVGALREHGPLSIQALCSFLEPAVTRRGLAKAMKRLRERGLVERYFGSLPSNSGHYFRLSRSSSARNGVADILGISVEDLSEAFVHGSELKHSEQCAIWAETFRRKFPEARVIRDWEWRRDRSLSESFGNGRPQRDLLPDFVLVVRASEMSVEVQIGVEIERSRKTPERLVNKVKGFLYQSMLDGVIYVCEREDVAAGVRRAFLKGQMEKSRRIGRYAKNFVLFSTYCANQKIVPTSGLNLGLEKRDFRAWVEAMSSVRQHLRTNQLFESVVQAGHQS